MNKIAEKVSRGIRGIITLLRNHARIIRNAGWRYYWRWNFVKIEARYRCRLNLKHYNVLSEQELVKTRRSDTVFIFGSGYSLNEISQKEWAYFQQHDIFGFTGFVYQKWVPVNYHLIRGAIEVLKGITWRPFAEEYMKILKDNSFFNNAVLLIQADHTAYFCNNLIGHQFISPGSRIFRYRTLRGSEAPSFCLRQGVVHSQGTLNDCVNLAFLMGWKQIVLVGVDLYDQRYFWLPPDQTWSFDESGHSKISSVGMRGQRYDQIHNTVKNGVIETLSEWSKEFEKRGTRLSIYNPLSLLAGHLPVYHL